MNNKIKRVGILTVLLLIAAINITTITKRKNLNPTGHIDASAAKTRSADRAAADPERERRRKESISLAAQKWYEELLEKYPRMKPVYRDVPDEKNGYPQFLLLAESVKSPCLPEDLQLMLDDRSKWDAGKLKAWLSENQSYFDQILRIAELPDHSTKGIAFDRIYDGPSRLCPEFSKILQASARAAFEGGDQESAFRYMKALGSLGDHFADIEVPSMLGEVISAGIRSRIRDSFYDHFLPALANDPQALRRWSNVIFRTEKPANEYARAVTGEWNTAIRSLLLPTLLGDHLMVGEVSSVDGAEFIDSYTLSIQKTADGVSKSGADRFDVAQSTLTLPPPDHTVKKTGERAAKLTAEAALFGLREMVEAFGVNATRNAMNAAAISILLGENPPLDPVSGVAFSWNAETLTLTSPGDEDQQMSITVPAQVVNPLTR